MKHISSLIVTLSLIISIVLVLSNRQKTHTDSGEGEGLVLCSAPSVPQPVFTITEKALTRASSLLKAPTSAFTFKTLLRHYAKQVLTPRSLNVKLGRQRNYHKGRAAIRHYVNQTARPL